MKRPTTLGVLMLLLAILAALTLQARGSARAQSSHKKQVGVLLYIGGSLGDLGFADSANAGVQRAHRSLGVNIKVIAQADSTQWQTQLLSLAGTHKYNLILVDTTDATMNSAVAALIKRYPTQRIVDYDDESFATKPEVSTIIYKQNEGSFLAGALSAMVADSHLKYVSHKRVIGMVGGMKVQVILDFKDGYVQGAKAVDPKMQVKVTYIGGSGGNDTWANKPAGARLARSLYDQGSAVVYQVAGGSGLGVLDQAKTTGRYAVGVDSNQDNLAPGHVIGSVTKRVDNSLFDLIKLYQEGKLKGNHIYTFGLQNQGVSLTRDAETRAIIPASMYKRLDRLAAEVASGKIKVKSEFSH
ncbi:MAG: BMP family ABC transporter substrate-binding protein [Chloroflexota bacterium]|nr:BMP family ABC transporter substrate-binding protein [Chloroflexota bacterium]